MAIIPDGEVSIEIFYELLVQQMQCYKPETCNSSCEDNKTKNECQKNVNTNNAGGTCITICKEVEPVACPDRKGKHCVYEHTTREEEFRRVVTTSVKNH